MELVPFTLIYSAKTNEPYAVERIVKHYEPYIDNRCTHRFLDENGVLQRFLDEDLRQIAMLALLSAISGFKFRGIPDISKNKDNNYEKMNELLFMKYCTVSISHAINNEKKKRLECEKHELPMSDAPEYTQAIIVQEYEKIEQTTFAPQTFFVQGRGITIYDGELALALKSLPPYMRELVFMKYYFHMKDKQIAAQMNISERTVERCFR